MTPSEVVHLVGRSLDTMPGYLSGGTYLISPHLGCTPHLEYLGIGSATGPTYPHRVYYTIAQDTHSTTSIPLRALPSLY